MWFDFFCLGDFKTRRRRACTQRSYLLAFSNVRGDRDRCRYKLKSKAFYVPSLTIIWCCFCLNYIIIESRVKMNSWKNGTQNVAKSNHFLAFCGKLVQLYGRQCTTVSPWEKCTSLSFMYTIPYNAYKLKAAKVADRQSGIVPNDLYLKCIVRSLNMTCMWQICDVCHC